MPLLPPELKARLPPLQAEAEADPFVYAKLQLPGTSLAWYVIEGAMTEGFGFVLHCLFVGQGEYSFGHFPEKFLEQFQGPNGEVVELDGRFTEGRLTDVVPAPDL